MDTPLARKDTVKYTGVRFDEKMKPNKIPTSSPRPYVSLEENETKCISSRFLQERHDHRDEVV